MQGLSADGRSRERLRRPRRYAAIAAAIIAGVGGALVTTAGGTASARTVPAHDASASTIDFGTIGPFTSAGTLNFGEEEGATAAFVDSVNASGGINGHKLKMISCDDEFLPNLETSCAQSITANKSIVAEAGGSLTYGDEVRPIIDAAHLPMIGDSGSIASQVDPLWFSLGPSEPMGYYADTVEAIDRGAKNNIGAIDEDLPSTVQLYAAIQAAATLYGDTSYQAQVTQATVDMSSAVSTLLADHVTGVVMAATVLQEAAATQLLRSDGFKGPIVFAPDLLGASDFKSFAPYSGVYGSSSLVPYTDTALPAVAAFTKAMKKYSPSTKLDGVALGSWVAMMVFKDALETIHGSVTRASVLAALNHLKTINTGGIEYEPPTGFTKPGPDPSDPRVINTKVVWSTISHGKEIVDDGPPKFHSAF